MTNQDARSNMNRRQFVGAGAASAVAGSLGWPQSASAASKAFWPNGARLAIALSMVVETGADPAPQTTAGDGKKYPDLYGASNELYASREGIPRMLDMFDRRKIKTTAMLCGASCEKYPALAKEIAQRGHECGAHGYMHELQYNMERDAEREVMRKATEAIVKTTGQKPLGYNCRGQLRSPNTLTLAQEMGYIYHIDDISRDEPFVFQLNGKPFATVPYTNHINDIGYFNNRGMAKAFSDELKYEFDALYSEAATRRRLMVVTIHDAISRAARIKAFDDFIGYAQAHKGVWFARGDELAKWALASGDSVKEAG